MAGFGGQGILFLGIALAEAGMRAGYNVSWIPSYGPEMRGGTANCQVNLSQMRVGSPVVSIPTVLIAMNLPSLDKFEPDVEKDGLIIYDSSLIDREVGRKDVEVVPIPATKIADDLGNTRVANMVALGVYVGYTGILAKEQILETLPEVVKRKELLPINEKAVEAGIAFAAELRKKK
jgi:Pyruvate/2-oxoacid:ferredoxin oxidoreductase gamma subunit